MARRKKQPIVVTLFEHGVIWWLLIGWWWRPFVFAYWLLFNIIFNVKIKFVKYKAGGNNKK